MTPEQQRIAIAIAEAKGWTDCHFPLASNVSLPFTQRVVCGIAPGQQTHSPLPDPGSLDTMHAAEKVLIALRAGNMHVYNEQLERVVLGYPLQGKDAVAEFMLRCATAAQRAEALLRTLNLWTTT
jgi:hypothetical protein